jgi:hypothetical protein
LDTVTPQEIAMPCVAVVARSRRACRAALAALLSCGPGFAASEGAPLRPYYYFVHWISSGRPDLALAQFSDDAIVVAGTACPAERPCVGKAAIRERYFTALRAGRLPLPLSDQRFDGARLRTRGEFVEVAGPDRRRVRIRGGHAIDLRDGHIAALRFEPDVDEVRLDDPPRGAP